MDITTLYEYILDFIKRDDFTDRHHAEQVRAIFTTICLIDGVQADTYNCDMMLNELYWEGNLNVLCIEKDDFENFMLELII